MFDHLSLEEREQISLVVRQYHMCEVRAVQLVRGSHPVHGECCRRVFHQDHEVAVTAQSYSPLLAISNPGDSLGFSHLIINIAITPGLARLQRPDHWVVSGTKVRGGMFVY
jgi:hypothetical protein